MYITKQELRKAYRQIRNQFPVDIRKKESDIVCKKLIDSGLYRDADIIFTYLSYGSELDTQLLIHKAFEDRKVVAVPRIDGKNMSFYAVQPDSEYVKNQYGIPEPVLSEEVQPDACQRALMILPGLCYDTENGRIGYGGGYYDRYLANYRERTNLSLVALALSCQYYRGIIPMEAHDIRPESVIFP